MDDTLSQIAAAVTAPNPEPKPEAETQETATSQPEPEREATPAPLPPNAQAALSVLMEKEAEVRAQLDAVKHLEKYRDIESMTPAQKAKALGLSLKDFQKAEIDAFDPTDGLKAQVSSLEAKLAAMTAKEQEAAQEAARNEARNQVRTYVDSSKDYQVTQALGLQDSVYYRVLEAAEKGQSISEAQAASEVEAKLREQVQAALKTGLFEIPEKPKPATKQTLSNKTSSETATKNEIDTGPMSFEQRVDVFASLLKTS